MWQSAFLLTMSSFGSGLIILFGIHKKAQPLVPVITMTIVISALGWLLLKLFEKRKPAQFAEAIYFCVMVIAASTVWQFQHYWASLGNPFQGFIGYKIIAVIFALQAPTTRWVGWSCAGLLLATPLVQYFTWTISQRALVGPQEPWLTVITIVCAALIYRQQLSHLRILEEKARLEALSALSNRFTHLLLGLQHISNTPLQVIESSVQLLQDRPADTEALLLRVEKSFATLRQISAVLSFDRLNLDWQDVRLPSTVEEFEKEILEMAKEMERHQKQSLNKNP